MNVGRLQFIWWGTWNFHLPSFYRNARYGVYEWRCSIGPLEIRKFTTPTET